MFGDPQFKKQVLGLKGAIEFWFTYPARGSTFDTGEEDEEISPDLVFENFQLMEVQSVLEAFEDVGPLGDEARFRTVIYKLIIGDRRRAFFLATRGRARRRGNQ